MEEDYNYTRSGFDNFLRRLPPKQGLDMTEDIFSTRFPQVTAKNVSGNLDSEAIEEGVDELVYVSTLQFGATLSIVLADGEQASLSTTITSRTSPGRAMQGVVEMSLYQDFVGGNSLIPYSYGLDEYFVYNRFDYHSNETSISPKKGLTYRESILNNTGSTHTIYFVFRWRYIGSRTTTNQ